MLDVRLHSRARVKGGPSLDFLYYIRELLVYSSRNSTNADARVAYLSRSYSKDCSYRANCTVERHLLLVSPRFRCIVQRESTRVRIEEPHSASARLSLCILPMTDLRLQGVFEGPCLDIGARHGMSGAISQYLSHTQLLFSHALYHG